MVDFATPGYEHMELSTQLVIKEALNRDVRVEVLDVEEQFIRLTQGERVEYLKEATKTSADSYITSLILGNKQVSKIILQENDIRLPVGQKYASIDGALSDYDSYMTGQFVVKPTTTNFGIGITVLPPQASKQRFEEAVRFAFSHDHTIIVEEFISGIECRFLVIDGVCLAVLHRVPAHVIGDGKQTIRALVDQKNADPRRGKGYKTPLEYIELGDVEKQVLAEESLDFDSVPLSDQQVFLRRNSNISTGGDSLDYTDVVHDEYKQIAVAAAHAVGAKICGVDMMMSDYHNLPQSDNHAIIELNYNPVLYFHDYPYEGKNRHTAGYVLDLLGF